LTNIFYDEKLVDTKSLNICCCFISSITFESWYKYKINFRF